MVYINTMIQIYLIHLRENELQARLQELNSKIPQTISIDMGNNKKQQATYHDLGIQIDTDAMVKAISTYGYEDDMWTLLFKSI